MGDFRREGDSNIMRRWKPLEGWTNVRKFQEHPPQHTHSQPVCKV